MASCNLKWNFNQGSFTPGAPAFVSFWLENNGPNALYVTDIELHFDFGTYTLSQIAGPTAPHSTNFVASTNLQLPHDSPGTKIYSLGYRLYEWINNTWIDLGVQHPPERFYLNIFPSPFYRAFVSRGTLPEDRQIGDVIAQMVRDWGFETLTVGIEVQVSEDQLPQYLRAEIQRSDAVIAIATPRYLDAMGGLWRTLEWLHNETGIAYGYDKPLLLLHERSTLVSGLPGYLSAGNQVPAAEFTRQNVEGLRVALQSIMPTFREWVATKRRQEFMSSLIKVIGGGLAIVGGLALAGGIGAGVSTSARTPPDSRSEQGFDR